MASMSRSASRLTRSRWVGCIRGMRVTVSMVLGQLAAGATIEDLLVDYPDLEREDLHAALEYGAAIVNERELPNLSPRIATRLNEAGFEARHVRDLNLVHASDEADFGMLLATRRASTPSVIQLRHVNGLRPDAQAGLLIAKLPTGRDDLVQGAIVSLSPARMALRSLPIERS
jgi:predicted nuclease of predicted toxin-antitoxin system